LDGRFTDQVAIITGGADGLGRAIAGRIGEEGGAIAIFDVNEALMEQTCRALSGRGVRVSGHRVDVSDEPSVAAGFEAVMKTHGRVDIMVNCAGIVGPSGITAADVAVEEFERVLKVNTVGSFLMTKHALRAMRPNNYGRILLVASIAGKEGNAGMTAYSTSKAAVIGLVKAAGKEFAETGITVNGLAPAVVKTALLDDIPPAQIKYMTDKIPMKRLCRLEEVAALSAWIVSKEASFNTAFVFDLTGGRATY
jgi:3-oxoacyl-[acyl-carrier protein] reductase